MKTSENLTKPMDDQEILTVNPNKLELESSICKMDPEKYIEWDRYLQIKLASFRYQSQ
ncbi:hypothetical protein BH18THE2_BH18THE2_31110 [soil metagenome]